MFKRRDWHIIVALTLFIMLLGGYYEKLSMETRTMVLPMVIIVGAAFLIVRVKRFEYEVRSATVVAQGMASQVFSLLDTENRERISISTVTGKTLMTFYDENHQPRAVLDLFDTEQGLKFIGNKGSILIGFKDDGMPHLSLRSETDEIVWQAPAG